MLSSEMYLFLSMGGGAVRAFIDSALSLLGPLAVDDAASADDKLRIGCPCLAAMLHGLSDGDACWPVAAGGLGGGAIGGCSC